MKKIVTYLIICFSYPLSGQHLIPDLPIYKGDVKKVTMNSIEYTDFDSVTGTYKKSDKIIWKSVDEFTKDNKVSRSISFYKKDIRADRLYEYDTISNKSFIKELINDNVNNNKGNYSLEEYIYASKKREKIKRYNIWFYHHNTDTLYLGVIIKDIKYDNKNNLVSFKQFGVDYKCDTIKFGNFEITYDSLNRIRYYDEMAYDSMTVYIKQDTTGMYRPKKISIKKPVLLNRIKYYYNDKGLMYLEVHELNAKEFYLDDKGYSNYYEFDEKNNWIRLYRMWEGQPNFLLRYEREIIYK